MWLARTHNSLVVGVGSGVGIGVGPGSIVVSVTAVREKETIPSIAIIIV